MFTAPNGGTTWEARLRIEFLTIDLNGDLRHDGENEGFFRVYRSTGAPKYLMAGGKDSGWPSSENCGYWTGTGSGRRFTMAKDIPGNARPSRRRCAAAARAATWAGRTRCTTASWSRRAARASGFAADSP